MFTLINQCIKDIDPLVFVNTAPQFKKNLSDVDIKLLPFVLNACIKVANIAEKMQNPHLWVCDMYNFIMWCLLPS